uniref:DUF7483 domain-containing protein n=1 Tax=uncultured marine bacterium MedDCM-OCT-S09-C145 TaxID=743075 RepID=D6PGM1_9BACT|nr:hypothetical protein [uncultured marine bacterium MedDCM-OCT-S09-C145]
MAYTTINKSSEHFNTKLYTGTGSTNAITGVGFQPDWVWLKERAGAGGHNIFDAVRGVTKVIYSNGTNAESTEAQALTTFGTDGFTLGTNTNVNESGMSMVGWNWKANGAGSANTDGSITSTVSANTTSGFSIVSYTGNGTAGATVGHGLGVAPKMIIIKRLNSSSNWMVYHSGLGGADHHIWLDLTTDIGTDTNSWNNTAPTSTVFSMGNRSENNASGGTYIAYCFADVVGYSKIGSYVGNGSSDGVFCFTGFKPAFILMKRSDTANSYDNWYIFDNKRDGFNPNNKKIAPNISDAESSDTGLFDLLSNGFKLRTTNSNNNGSGGNFIYMAIAEAPLVGSNNIPCTAR